MTNRNIYICTWFYYQSLFRKTQKKKDMLNIRLDVFKHYVAVFSFDVDNNRTEFRSEKGKVT